MKKRIIVSVLFTLVVSGAALVYADSNFRKLKALLIGTQEVPVVLTAGNGTFDATISKDETEIN